MSNKTQDQLAARAARDAGIIAGALMITQAAEAYEDAYPGWRKAAKIRRLVLDIMDIAGCASDEALQYNKDAMYVATSGLQADILRRDIKTAKDERRRRKKKKDELRKS